MAVSNWQNFARGSLYQIYRLLNGVSLPARAVDKYNVSDHSFFFAAQEVVIMRATTVWSLVFILCAAVFLTPTAPALAGGSVLDTLHQAEEQGTSANVTPLAALATGSISFPGGSGSSNVTTLTPAQIQKIIQDLLQSILSRFGLGSGGIVIKLPPAVPPAPVFPPATSTISTGSSGSSSSSGSSNSSRSASSAGSGSSLAVSGLAGLKSQMKANYGITAQDGDGAAWNEKQVTAASAVLARLPARFRGCTKTITRDRIFQSASVLGYVRLGIPTVHIMNSACTEGTFQGTIVHEMTHCFQSANPSVNTAWSQKFWPNGRAGGARPASVSSYGNTQPIEDFAESVRVYFQSGASMKASQPERYDFIKKYVMGGVTF